MQDYCPKMFDSISAWIADRIGQRFQVEDFPPNTPVEYYIDDNGFKRVFTWSKAKDPENLVKYLKIYIDKTNQLPELPQVEFSNDYSKFKIYKHHERD